MKRTLVIGLGNPLRGDDGIGPRVAAELAAGSLPEGVEALDAGAAGLDLLNLLDGAQRAIVIDAAAMGREPGQYVRFTPDAVRLAGAGEGVSFHRAGLAEVLALAGALDQPLPEMVIFGVQPASLDWGQGLSPAVEAAVPGLVDAVRAEIGGNVLCQPRS